MLLSISTVGPAASDLGFLLHKHPDRFQSFDLAFGKCHAFYPESNEQRCTFCLLLEVDPIALGKKQRTSSFALAGYVNDRPYVASSFLSVAIAQVLGSALSGRCGKREDLIEQEFDFRVELATLPVKGGESFLRSVFEPLGYCVEAQNQVLDEKFEEWGNSPYFNLTLRHTLKLQQLLSHLYVLIPVFDNQKHYFVGRDELEKLLRKGEGWLANHPEKEAISRRYLRFRGGLYRQALEQLADSQNQEQADERSDIQDASENALERSVSLHEKRLETVKERVLESGSTSILDLGCGEGKLIKKLLKEWQLKRIVGMDVSHSSLENASRRLRLDELPQIQAERISLLHGSLMYRDKRFEGFDVATLVEVIEHLDPPRLKAMERVVFGDARPNVIIVTTPNFEYNVKWESLAAGKFRHGDHRFEWTRKQFSAWCESMGSNYGYSTQIEPLGDEDPSVGAPSQMCVFRIATPNQDASNESAQTQSSAQRHPAVEGSLAE